MATSSRSSWWSILQSTNATYQITNIFGLLVGEMGNDKSYMPFLRSVVVRIKVAIYFFECPHFTNVRATLKELFL